MSKCSRVCSRFLSLSVSLFHFIIILMMCSAHHLGNWNRTREKAQHDLIRVHIHSKMFKCKAVKKFVVTSIHVYHTHRNDFLQGPVTMVFDHFSWMPLNAITLLWCVLNTEELNGKRNYSENLGILNQHRNYKEHYVWCAWVRCTAWCEAFQVLKSQYLVKRNLDEKKTCCLNQRITAQVQERDSV